MPDSSRSIDWAINDLAQLFDAVLTAAQRSGDLTDTDREHFAEVGAGAFTSGSSLSGLIDTYLGGAGELWEHVFADADPARTIDLGRALRRVSEQAVSSLAEGFEAAQRRSIRAEESQRRAFLDDLLAGDGDPAQLAVASRQVGFPAFERLVVAVVAADRSLNDGGPVQARIRTELHSRAPTRDIRVTAKGGRIVVLAADTRPTDLASLCAAAITAVDDVACRVGVGDATSQLDGVSASFRHALDAMHLAQVFDLDSPTEFDHILPERLLAADPVVARSLIEKVIGPLTTRTNRELLVTLEAFFDHGGNMAEVARTLRIGARTVAYRLDRIDELTGYSLRRPHDRFALEVAVRALPLRRR